MARDITDFIVYAVEDAVDRRPDLILMYYPSKYDFYWFLARTVQLLKRHQDSLNEPLKYAFENLLPLMKVQGTNQILHNKKTAHNPKDSVKKSFWV